MRVSCRARRQLDDFVGQFAVVGHGVERGQRGCQRLAPGRDFGFVLGDMLAAAVPGDAEPSHHRRQHQPGADQRDEDDAERDEQDQVAMRESLRRSGSASGSASAAASDTAPRTPVKAITNTLRQDG